MAIRKAKEYTEIPFVTEELFQDTEIDIGKYKKHYLQLLAYILREKGIANERIPDKIFNLERMIENMQDNIFDDVRYNVKKIITAVENTKKSLIEAEPSLLPCEEEISKPLPCPYPEGEEAYVEIWAELPTNAHRRSMQENIILNKAGEIELPLAQRKITIRTENADYSHTINDSYDAKYYKTHRQAKVLDIDIKGYQEEEIRKIIKYFPGGDFETKQVNFLKLLFGKDIPKFGYITEVGGWRGYGASGHVAFALPNEYILPDVQNAIWILSFYPCKIIDGVKTTTANFYLGNNKNSHVTIEFTLMESRKQVLPKKRTTVGEVQEIPFPR